jgi:hypothetical protein
MVKRDTYWSEGSIAQKRGKTRADNPYTHGTIIGAASWAPHGRVLTPTWPPVRTGTRALAVRWDAGWRDSSRYRARVKQLSAGKTRRRL